MCDLGILHGLTGMSIELKLCLRMSWYDLESNVVRVCKVCQASKVCHDLQNDFHTFVVRLQVWSSTVCYGLVRLNTAFNRLTGHLQGLHTVPPTFVRVRFHTIYIRY